jgi:subtilase family protein
MHSMRRGLSLSLGGGLAAALTILAAVAPAAQAAGERTAYSVPSGAWSQFNSELNSAGGLASGQGLTVALLSTGVDTSGTGLAGKVTQGPDYIDKKPARSPHNSGTITASLIVGVPDVVQGAAPDARILSLRIMPGQGESGTKKFFDNDNFDSSESGIIAKAINYAVAHGARVIEVDTETGNDGAVPALGSAVSNAVAKGAVIVAQEGGPGKQTGDYEYPASLPGVIGVASIMLPGGTNPDTTGSGSGQADMTAKNNSVLVAGPGDWIQATSDGWGPYGTSAATAYVTGTVALIKQRYPSLSPALVERALAMSARDKPSGGYSKQVGFGVLDPYDAVLDAAGLARLATSAGPGQGSVAAQARFGSGPPPGVINALPSAKPEIIGSYAGIGVGAVLLVLAVVLAIRGRRRKRRGKRASGPHAPGPHAPGPQAPGPQAPGPWAIGAPPANPQYPGSAYPGPQYPGPRPSGAPPGSPG